MAIVKNYYVIRFSEGSTSVACFTKEELEAKLAEDYWGKPKFLDADSNFENEEGLLIIKGERIAPKPVDVVRKWGV